MTKRKEKWVVPFSSKHNILAKRRREQAAKDKVKIKKKIKLTLIQNIKFKGLKFLFKLYCLGDKLRK